MFPGSRLRSQQVRRDFSAGVAAAERIFARLVRSCWYQGLDRVMFLGSRVRSQQVLRDFSAGVAAAERIFARNDLSFRARRGGSDTGHDRLVARTHQAAKTGIDDFGTLGGITSDDDR